MKRVSLIIILAAVTCGQAFAAEVVPMKYKYRDDITNYLESNTFVICSNCPQVKTLSPALKVFPLSIRMSSPYIDIKPTETVKTQVPRPDVKEGKGQKRSSTEKIAVVEFEKAEVIHFQLSSFDLTHEAKNKIKELMQLQASELIKKVEITGFTCDIGAEDYNNELALKRAKAVEAFIVQNGLGEPISVSGKGKCCYVSPDKKLNRRAEIKLTIEKKN